ncbi:hypothetical protein AM427_002214 [Escherichia coli]|nr:hypothetical protein AM427_002214 [Escherichia coli]
MLKKKTNYIFKYNCLSGYNFFLFYIFNTIDYYASGLLFSSWMDMLGNNIIQGVFPT